MRLTTAQLLRIVKDLENNHHEYYYLHKPYLFRIVEYTPYIESNPEKLDSRLKSRDIVFHALSPYEWHCKELDLTLIVGY